MGRKSSLTAEQWVEVERRHVVDGESINSLAAEYGVNESSIRRKIKPNKAESPNRQNPLQALALDKIKADFESRRIAEQIAVLPYAKQAIVSDLARKLTNISDHLGSAAEYGAATAHRLAGIANGLVSKISDADPLAEGSLEELKGIAALTRTANDASEIALNLMKANKDTIDELNKREMPKASTHHTIEFVKP